MGMALARAGRQQHGHGSALGPSCPHTLPCCACDTSQTLIVILLEPLASTSPVLLMASAATAPSWATSRTEGPLEQYAVWPQISLLAEVAVGGAWPWSLSLLPKD